MSGTAEHGDIEREAIEHDRDLAWELYGVQPQHPRILELTRSVLVREPSFTGMIILAARHHEACGRNDEARRLLQELVSRRDRQYVNAVRQLRDLELAELNYAESRRLAEVVLREQPDTRWDDVMAHGVAAIFADSPEAGWRIIDDAVALAGSTDPEGHADALADRAEWLWLFGAPPERFLAAAEQAIVADPSNPDLPVPLAYAYIYHYRPEEAETLLLRVLREDPTDGEAQGGLAIARGMLEPIRSGLGTIDDFRAAGMGEFAWRYLRDVRHGTGLDAALAALDEVMPEELASSLRPGLAPEAAERTGGEQQLLAWHDGQRPGSGAAWGAGEDFRLMTDAEIAEMDEAIEQHPEAWPGWDEAEFFTQILTDDAGAYIIQGVGGRLYRRSAGEADREVAPSIADWVWDRVVAFGGADPRSGQA